MCTGCISPSKPRKALRIPKSVVCKKPASDWWFCTKQFEGVFDGFITKRRLWNNQDGNLVKQFWWEKKCKMATEIAKVTVFYEMSFDTLTFKLLVLQVILTFVLKKIKIISGHSNSKFAHHNGITFILRGVDGTFA